MNFGKYVYKTPYINLILPRKYPFAKAEGIFSALKVIE